MRFKVMIRIKAFGSTKDRCREYGPFEGFRIREGRYLLVCENGVWKKLAWSWQGEEPFIPGDESGAQRPVPVKLARLYNLWHFLDEAGNNTAFMSENLDFIFTTEVVNSDQ